jgi:hypothetical protein
MISSFCNGNALTSFVQYEMRDFQLLEKFWVWQLRHTCGTRSCFPPCRCPPPARHSFTSAARACLARSTWSSRLGRHPHGAVAAWRGIPRSARGTDCSGRDADLKHWDVIPRHRHARELRLLRSSRRYRFDRLLDLMFFYDNLETWLNIVSP